jgi:PAS domain S-box-containing protein
MTDSGGTAPHKKFLNFLALLAGVLLLGSTSLLLTRSWEEGKADHVAAMESIVDMSAIALDSYFTQLKLGMEMLGTDIGTTREGINLERTYRQVSRFQRLHAELGNVMLLREDGQVLLTGTTPFNSTLLTLGGDSAFVTMRNELMQGSPFAVGRPVLGRIDTRWVVAARYAITDPEGKLRFILSANLPGDFLRRFLPDAHRGAAFGLMRSDGYLVSRYPEPDAAERDALYGKPVRGAMLDYLRRANESRDGRIELSGNEGASVVRVIRRLKDFPLIAYIDVPKTEIEAAGWKRVKSGYVLTILLLATVFVTYGMAHRHRRKWSVAKRREMLRRGYEQTLLERSPNEIFMFDATTMRIKYANDAALENSGYTLGELQQKTVLALYPDQSVESFGKIIEPVRRGERESVDFETSQQRANGSSYPVEVHLQLVKADDGEEGFLAIINDISARRLAEANINQFNAPVERRVSTRK